MTTVLVVDDERDVRSLLADTLTGRRDTEQSRPPTGAERWRRWTANGRTSSCST